MGGMSLGPVAKTPATARAVVVPEVQSVSREARCVVQSTTQQHPRVLSVSRVVAPSFPSSSASAQQGHSVEVIRLNSAASAAAHVPDGQVRVTGQE